VTRSTRERRILGACFALYVALTVVLAMHHEPWRDEADAWLVSRDASPLDVIHLAGHSGTPCLWYFVQMPLAKAGLPFAAQGALNLAFVAAASAVLLALSPLPLKAVLPLLFGYYFAFEYAVVARNYGLGIFLLFVAAAWDERKLASPLVYAGLLAALANVSAHFLFLALALGLVWLWDLLRAHSPGAGFSSVSARTWGALGIAGAGLVFALYQLIPRPGGQFPDTLLTIFVPRRLFGPVRALFPEGMPVWLAPLAVAAWAAAVARVARSLRALVFLGVGTAALTYIFVFKHVGGDRHYGLLLVTLVAALWLAEIDSSCALDAVTPSRRERWAEAARSPCYWLLFLSLSFNVVFSVIKIFPRELREDYSGAEEMGHYLATTGMKAHSVAAHPAYAAEAVLPYLPGTRFFYPALETWGTHMLWDRHYAESLAVTQEEALALLFRQVPRFRVERWLLLFNEPVPHAEARGLSLVHRSPGTPWRVPDETFYLYAAEPFSVSTGKGP